jgi:hypothetical protein
MAIAQKASWAKFKGESDPPAEAPAAPKPAEKSGGGEEDCREELEEEVGEGS